jgi:hypothetical protein
LLDPWSTPWRVSDRVLWLAPAGQAGVPAVVVLHGRGRGAIPKGWRSELGFLSWSVFDLVELLCSVGFSYAVLAARACLARFGCLGFAYTFWRVALEGAFFSFESFFSTFSVFISWFVLYFDSLIFVACIWLFC